MRDFFQQSDRIYFDEGQCSDNPETDVDINIFQEFRMSAGLSQIVQKEQIFNSLKIVLSNGKFKNGGVLFFGKKPESFYDKAVTRCVVFEGTNKTQIIDDKIYGGPLMNQYHQAMQWLKGKLDVRYDIKGSGPREEKWEIPETVFKEAIIKPINVIMMIKVQERP
jgi:ATP-dependent DNA helicase RecG